MAWSLRKLLRVASESTMSVLHLGEATPLWGQDKRRLSLDDGQNWRRIRDQLEFTADQDYAPTSTNRQSFAGWLIYRLAPSADRTIDLSGGTFNEAAKATVINDSTSAADLLVKLTDTITHVVNPGESWTGEHHDGAWSSPWLLPGFRNKLINGDMRIDQRNAGAAKTYTAGAGRAYGVDRWWVQCTGANMSGQRVAGSTAPFGYKLSGAINVTNIIIGQIIEALNSAPLKNRIVTVSCVLFADAQHTITWRARRAGADDDWTSPVQLGTGSIDVTAVPRRFQFSFNAGSSANLGMSVQFETGAFGAGTYLQVESVQLEEGPVATQFESISFEQEQLRCFRYARHGKIGPGASGKIAAPQNVYTSILQSLSPPMRITPSIPASVGVLPSNPLFTNQDNCSGQNFVALDSERIAAYGVQTTSGFPYWSAVWEYFLDAEF